MNIFKRFWYWLFGAPILSTTDTTTVKQPACYCYEIPATGGDLGPSFQVDYIDCMGNSVTDHIGPQRGISFCAKEKTVKTAAPVVKISACTKDCGKITISTNDIV